MVHISGDRGHRLLQWTLLVLSTGLTVQGTCRWPPLYKVPRRWVYGYPTNDLLLLESFTDDGLTESLSNDIESPTMSYACRVQLADSPRYVTTRHLVSEPNLFQCLETRFLTTLILQKQTPTGRGWATTSFSVAECEPILAAVPYYMVLLEHPVNLDKPSCPFVAGRYQVQFSVAPGKEGLCQGDTSSVAIVSGNTISFDTCTSQGERILREYRCVDGILSRDLDGTGGSGKGDAVILSDESATAKVCSRYNIVGRVVYMSFYTKSVSALYCPLDSDYHSYGTTSQGSAVAFLLTWLSDAASSIEDTTSQSNNRTPKPKTKCVWPPKFRAPKRWVLGNVAADVYILESFTDDGMMDSLSSDVETATMSYSCRYHERASPLYVTTRYSNAQPDKSQCIENRFLDDIVLQKETPPGRGGWAPEDLTIEDCKGLLDVIPYYRVLLSYPVETATPECPFVAGRYQVQFSVAPGKEDLCQGDTSSGATVSGNTISFDTCTSQGQRIYVEYQCIAAISAQDLDENGGSNADMVILRDKSTTATVCGRYRVEDPTVYLSVYTKSESSVYCPLQSDHQSFGPTSQGNAIAFAITPRPVTSGADPDATSPPDEETTRQPEVIEPAQAPPISPWNERDKAIIISILSVAGLVAGLGLLTLLVIRCKRHSTSKRTGLSDPVSLSPGGQSPLSWTSPWTQTISRHTHNTPYGPAVDNNNLYKIPPPPHKPALAFEPSITFSNRAGRTILNR